MRTVLPLLLGLVFLALALWHFYRAFAPSSGETAAVPSVGGKPLFVPSTGATLAVGVVLVLFAALVGATGGLLPAGFLAGIPAPVLRGLSYALALGLLVRAIGDFRYVGFFKRIRGSRFARMDTLVYSPLCLLLALGVAVVALRRGR
jgi:hypothetical protein